MHANIRQGDLQDNACDAYKLIHLLMLVHLIYFQLFLETPEPASSSTMDLPVVSRHQNDEQCRLSWKLQTRLSHRSFSSLWIHLPSHTCDGCGCHMARPSPVSSCYLHVCIVISQVRFLLRSLLCISEVLCFLRNRHGPSPRYTLTFITLGLDMVSRRQH